MEKRGEDFFVFRVCACIQYDSAFKTSVCHYVVLKYFLLGRTLEKVSSIRHDTTERLFTGLVRSHLGIRKNRKVQKGMFMYSRYSRCQRWANIESISTMWHRRKGISFFSPRFKPYWLIDWKKIIQLTSSGLPWFGKVVKGNKRQPSKICRWMKGKGFMNKGKTCEMAVFLKLRLHDH